MNTRVPEVKTKFAVHWAPAVKVCTPGWTVAVDAGAQAEAAPVGTMAAPTMRAVAMASAPCQCRRRAPLPGRGERAGVERDIPDRFSVTGVTPAWAWVTRAWEGASRSPTKRHPRRPPR